MPKYTRIIVIPEYSYYINSIHLLYDSRGIIGSRGIFTNRAISILQLISSV